MLQVNSQIHTHAQVFIHNPHHGHGVGGSGGRLTASSTDTDIRLLSIGQQITAIAAARSASFPLSLSLPLSLSPLPHSLSLSPSLSLSLSLSPQTGPISGPRYSPGGYTDQSPCLRHRGEQGPLLQRGMYYTLFSIPRLVHSMFIHHAQSTKNSLFEDTETALKTGHLSIHIVI